MRLRLVLLVATLTAAAAATAGASPSRTPTVSYPIKVEFGVGITVKWSHDRGQRTGACSTWSHEEGTYEIDAGSIGEIPAGGKTGMFIHPVGSQTGLGSDPHWAILYAAGKAKVHMKRTLKQEGQTNACGNVGVVKTKFPPNDCGERTYVSRSALVRPDSRGKGLTLTDLLRTPAERFRNVIAIDAQAQQRLYRQCSVPVAEFPIGIQNVPVWVGPTAIRRLRGLKEDRSVQFNHVLEFDPSQPDLWQCIEPISEGFACTFELDAHVDIKRVKPPSGR